MHNSVLQVANLEPALAHADKLLDQTEGTPCGNAPSADKVSARSCMQGA